MTSTAPLVAVAGGTSKQGRSVVRALLADGRFRVCALTRDPSSPQARELARLGADVAAAPLEPGMTTNGSPLSRVRGTPSS